MLLQPALLALLCWLSSLVLAVLVLFGQVVLVLVLVLLLGRYH